MPPLAQDPAIAKSDPSAAARVLGTAEDAVSSLEAGRKLYNLPLRSEKLTDATLPLSWPVPYLDSMKAADEAPALDLVDTSSATDPAAPLSKVHDDYAQLMRKLHAESVAVRGAKSGDKALYAAHYISTLIAAMAFIAMMGIVILNFFPDLTHP